VIDALQVNCSYAKTVTTLA